MSSSVRSLSYVLALLLVTSGCRVGGMPPIYLNLPDLATAPLKGVEWHG
jgi:hypothetical protein